MESVTVWVAGVAAVLSVCVTLAMALAWRASARRTAAQITQLQEALAAVAAPAATRRSSEPVMAEFLITDIGAEPSETSARHAEAPTRVVLSATMGEPLLRLAALAYGVRTALRPENRNRIRFEMRREVRRARRQRRSAGRAAAAEARSQAVRS